jgi:hypothetical protein
MTGVSDVRVIMTDAFSNHLSGQILSVKFFFFIIIAYDYNV